VRGRRGRVKGVLADRVEMAGEGRRAKRAERRQAERAGVVEAGEVFGEHVI